MVDDETSQSHQSLFGARRLGLEYDASATPRETGAEDAAAMVGGHSETQARIDLIPFGRARQALLFMIWNRK